jgi:hypothetical protein
MNRRWSGWRVALDKLIGGASCGGKTLVFGNKLSKQYEWIGQQTSRFNLA